MTTGTVCILNAQVSLFSATRLAGEERMKDILGLDDIPKNVKPLLQQAVVPTDLLNPLEKFRKQLRDFLLKKGARAELLGWVVSPDPVEVGEIIGKLEDLKKEFEAGREVLLATYPKVCSDYLDTLRQECEKENARLHAEGKKGINCNAFIDAVRAAQPSISYLRSQVKFAFLRPRQITLDATEVETVRATVYDQALHEVSKRVEYAVGKAEYVTTQIRALEEVVAKLDSLGYLEPRFRRITGEINTILSKIPRGIKNEEYSTQDRLVLAGVLSTLGDKDKLIDRMERGQGLFPAPLVPQEAAAEQTQAAHPTEPVASAAPQESLFGEPVETEVPTTTFEPLEAQSEVEETFEEQTPIETEFYAVEAEDEAEEAPTVPAMAPPPAEERVYSW